MLTRCPVSQAMKTILLGKPLTAAEALACGLVAEVAPEQDLLSVSIELARIIVNRSPEAVQFAKQAINKGKFQKHPSGQSDPSSLELLTFDP